MTPGWTAKLNVVRAHFAKLREKYIANGQINPRFWVLMPTRCCTRLPGGMLSNMIKQLKDAGKEDQLDEVLKEIPRVREDAGYPPLVTPTSQIVGTQAVFNVIMGERYKMVTKEFKAWSMATTARPRRPSSRNSPEDPQG